MTRRLVRPSLVSLARLASLVPLAVGLAGAFGCTTRDRVVNPVGPMWLHRPAWALHLAFRTPLAADQGVASKIGIERSVPAIDWRHGRVFVGTSDGGLYAVRAGDGSVLWRFQTAGTVQCEPLYDEARDVVYFGSDDDGLYAVRARDGALLWRYRTRAEVQRRPILARRSDGRSTLVFVNAADAVFSIDADTGAPIWRRERTPALGLEIAGHAGISVDRDRVFAGFSTGRVAAYDLETGADKWPEVDLSTGSGATAEDEQKPLDVDTTPVVRGDRVFVAAASFGVFALDSTGGGQAWRRREAEGVSWLRYWEEPAHKDPFTRADIPARALLIAGSGTTGLWALDPRTGEVRWRRRPPRGSLSYPVEIEGAMLVTSSKLGMFLFDPANGEVVDGIDPGSGFAGGAATHGGRAFVVTNGGILLGLEVIPPSRYDLTARTW